MNNKENLNVRCNFIDMLIIKEYLARTPMAEICFYDMCNEVLEKCPDTYLVLKFEEDVYNNYIVIYVRKNEYKEDDNFISDILEISYKFIDKYKFLKQKIQLIVDYK